MITLLGCSGFPGIPSEPVDIDIEINGASLSGSTAEASYYATRHLFQPGFLSPTYKEMTHPVVELKGQHLSITALPSSLSSVGGLRLRYLSVGGDLGLSFNDLSVPTAPPPPGSGGISGIDNPLEFAQPDGTGARFSSHAAFLPSSILVNPAGIERIEITIDTAMVPETLFLATSSMFKAQPLLGWADDKHAATGASHTTQTVSVKPGVTVPLPIKVKMSGGWPSRSTDAPEQLVTEVIVIDDARLLSIVGWKQKTSPMPLTRGDIDALAAARSTAVETKVVTIDKIRAVELSVPQAAKGSVALVVYTLLPGQDLTGAAYLSVRIEDR